MEGIEEEIPWIRTRAEALLAIDAVRYFLKHSNKPVSSSSEIVIRIPPSFFSVGLYGNSQKLRHRLSSLVEEFKAAKAID